jgi:mitogen-activated protein kinase organizer 1
MTACPTSYRKTLEGHSGHVWVVRYNSKGNYCMSGGQDKSVKLWNPHKGTLVQSYKDHSKEVMDLCIAKDNSHFTSVSCDRVAIVWDVETSTPRVKYRGHSQKINSVSYNNEENILVTGSYDNTVRLWDMRYILQTYHHHY